MFTKFFRDALGGNVFEDKVRCSGRTIIVTGANCGMGEATASNLAQRGYIYLRVCKFAFHTILTFKS